MWQSVQITTTGAAGSATGTGIIAAKETGPMGTALLMKVYVPAQDAFISGTSDVTISDFFPPNGPTLGAIATWTNITTPATRVPKVYGYDSSGTQSTSQTDYTAVQAVSIAIAQANAGTVTVWVLFG